MCDSNDTREYNYGNLPPHIIAQIVSQLTFKDICNASVACKSWHYASSDPIVTKNIRVNFKNSSSNCDYLSRSIHTARFEVINWRKLQYRKILRNFGSTIVELDIFTSITLTKLFEFFVYLPNVRYLKIVDTSKYVSTKNFINSKKITKYQDVIRRNLAHLRKVDIWTELRDLKLYRLFLSYCTNIEVLHWYGGGPERKDVDADFLYNYLLEPSENLALYKLIELHLDSIDFNQSDKFFEKIVQLSLTNIRKLSLAHISSNYYHPIFTEFCKLYRLLDKLSLTGCNDQHLNNICKYMKNLKIVKLNRCRAINFSQLLNLKHLEVLIIYRTDRIVNDDLQVFLNNEHKLLKVLNISHIDSNILHLICENCKNLEDLTIGSMSTKDCEPIFCNLIKLKKLSLTFEGGPTINSSRIQSSDLYNITNLTEIEDLYISCYVPGITPELINRVPKLKGFCDYIWDPPFEEESIENGEQIPDGENSLENDISDYSWYQELIL